MFSPFTLHSSLFIGSVVILPGGCKNSHPVGFPAARTWLSECFRFVGNLFEAGLPWLSATSQDDRIPQSSAGLGEFLRGLTVKTASYPVAVCFVIGEMRQMRRNMQSASIGPCPR